MHAHFTAKNGELALSLNISMGIMASMKGVP
jgi:hypothetical protein